MELPDRLRSGEVGNALKRRARRGLMLTRRLKLGKKSAPRRGTDTGLSWKFQEYALDPEPQEKLRGIIQEPLHTMGDPSDVRRQTLSME